MNINNNEKIVDKALKHFILKRNLFFIGDIVTSISIVFPIYYLLFHFNDGFSLYNILFGIIAIVCIFIISIIFWDSHVEHRIVKFLKEMKTDVTLQNTYIKSDSYDDFKKIEFSSISRKYFKEKKKRRS